MKHFILTCTFILVTGLSVMAQETDSISSFSLIEAQEYALKHNDSLRLADAEVRIADKQVMETTAIGLPQVNASLEGQYFFDIPTQLLPDFVSPSVYQILFQEGLVEPRPLDLGGMVPAQFGTNYNVTAGISVSQLIFDGQYIVGLQASRAFKDLSRSMKSTDEINVKARVATLYLQASVLEESIDVLKNNMVEIEKNVAEMKAMFEQGFTEQTDVDRLELSKQRLENQVASLENAHAVIRLLLKMQMGYPVDQPIQLKEGFRTHLEEDASLFDQQADPKKRPEYKTLITNRRLQELDKKRYTAGYLPSLSGFFSYSENALVNEFEFGNGDNWFPTTVGGIKFNLPIFDGFTKSAKIQQAKLAVEKADIQIHQFEQSVKFQVMQARENYRLSLNRYQLEERNLDLTKRIYERAKIKYKEGVGSSFEMTSALSDHYSAQTAFLDASYKMISARIQLEKALGQYN